MKTCKRCGETKPLEDMKKDKRYADGRAAHCKKCHKIEPEHRKRWNKADRDNWPDGYRPCLQCHKMLPFSEFGKNRNLWGGVTNQCKPCRKVISKKYYDKWLRNNVETRMLCSAKSRAKSQGVPFAITVSDIVIPEVCPVLGIKIVRNGGKGNPATPSLDRFVPELGYVPGNIHVISWRANWIKQNSTNEEIQKLANWMESTSNI